MSWQECWALCQEVKLLEINHCTSDQYIPATSILISHISFNSLTGPVYSMAHSVMKMIELPSYHCQCKETCPSICFVDNQELWLLINKISIEPILGSLISGPGCLKDGKRYSQNKSLSIEECGLFCQHLSSVEQFIWLLALSTFWTTGTWTVLGHTPQQFCYHKFGRWYGAGKHPPLPPLHQHYCT